LAKEPIQQQSATLDIPIAPDYDFLEITPDTWSELVLEVNKTDGSVAIVHLLRPNTWLEEQELCNLGDSTWIDFQDMKLTGMARMIHLQAATTDTRSVAARALLSDNYQPILSTFKHKSDEVLHIRFTNGDKLVSTAPHPFWSLDRDGWLAAEKLHFGERVKTVVGETAVDTMWLEFGRTEVYNLEVKEAHSYCVGDGGEVVHNACVDDLVAELKDWYKKKIRCWA
jgi:hypothetical protein